MEKLKKEFILNASIVSIVIAVALAAIGAAIDVNTSELSNPGDWFIPFIVLLLVLYMFNLFVSIVNYVLGQKIKNIGARLLTFNILGLVIILSIWFFISEIIVLASFSTFILFTLVAVIVNQTKNNAHA